MTIRMGYWDCPSCTKKRNPGPSATCEQCGRPRGPNIPFYTDDSAPVVEDPELIRRARAGADWKCKFCGADNRAGVIDCHQCGAGPDGTVSRQQRYIPNATQPKKNNLPLILAIVGGGLAIVFSLIYFLFIRTTELTMEVQRVSWVKTVALEQLTTRRGEAWADETPSGARRISSEERGRDQRVQEGTEKIKVGKKDLGNGLFEDIYEEKPKYVTKKVSATWVRYEVDEWVTRDTLREETSDGNEPADPSKGRRLNANERFGDRQSRIEIALRGDNGKSYRYDIDASKDGGGKSRSFEVGKRYKARVNGVGSVVSLGP
jgi:hypothetical protein